MIKAITFDLWWTILLDTHDHDETRKKARMKDFHRILGSHGFNLSPNDLHSAYDSSRKILEDVWSTNAEIAPRDQIKAILEIAQRDISKNLNDDILSALDEAYGSAMVTHLPSLDDEIAKILKACRKRESKIGLICNTGRSSGKYLTMALVKLGIVDYFDVMVYSNEVGIRKPDPKIFQVTLERLRAAPDTTVHVGDELRADVMGAKNAGIRAIWVNRRKEKLQEGMPKPDCEIGDLTGLLGILDMLQ